MEIYNKNVRLPGLRNIKTGLCVFIVLTLYQFLGRENEFIAITAAVICLQDSVSKSLSEGRNRVISTIVGGIYGLLFIVLGIHHKLLINNFEIALSCILIIYICNLINKPELIINGLFVFILVVLVPANEMSPIHYAANRIIDTLIGIVIAVIVNRYFFPPKEQRVFYKRTVGTFSQLKKDCKFIKAEHCKQSTWAGGEALELLIYPKNSLYEDFDFKYRISISDTQGEMDLSLAPNYYRRTMILSGETTFSHEGYHTIKLKQFDQDFFKGSVKTKSKGKTTNFNLMLAKGYESDIVTVKNNEFFDLLTITHDDLNVFDVACFYSLYDQNVFTITKQGQVVFTKILNKGDTIVFKHLKEYKIDEYIVNIKNSYIDDKKKVVCVKAIINKNYNLI